MGLGNGNANSGNKGSNFNFEMRHLQLLGQLAAAAAPPPPGGLATEATALNILAAINNSNQDLEILLVRDTGNGDLVVKQIQELVGGAISYEDVNGNPYVPTGPIEYLDPSAVLNLMLSELIALNTNDFATETTLADILTDTTSIDGKVATEVTLAALLVAFNSEDFATEATLAALEGKDFATEATLTALAATDFATETTLASVNSNVQLGNITLNNILTAFNSEDFAQEATLAALSAKFNTLGQKLSAASHPVVLSTEQQQILADIETAISTIDTSTLATEVTLLATNALLTTIDTVLDAIKLDTGNLDVALSTVATEATLSAVETLLTSLDGKDFATETTLGVTNTALAGIGALLNSIDLKMNSLGQKASAASMPVVLSTEQEVILDAIKTAVENLDMDVDGIATETTLEACRVLLVAIDGVLDNIKLDTANLDVALSTLATESTLSAIETLLTSIDGKDFATEATLSAIETLITSLDGKDFATETTLATLATEATASSIDGQFTGGVVVTRTDISGVASTVVPAGTYKSIQLIVTAGSVSDGTITYPAGVYNETAPLNQTLSTVTFNATGATAYLKLMA